MENIFSKLNIKKPSNQRNRIINPHKHWVYILYLFFTMLVFVIGFSLYLLFEIKNEQIFQSEDKSEVKKSFIKDKLLKNVQESFNQKSERTLNLGIEPIHVDDPSR